MIIDDEKPRPARTTDILGADLSHLSVADLQERVEAFQAEIVRTQSEMAKKQAQSNAAEAFFKK